MYLRRLRMIVPVRGPFYVRVFTTEHEWKVLKFGSQHFVQGRDPRANTRICITSILTIISKH